MSPEILAPMLLSMLTGVSGIVIGVISIYLQRRRDRVSATETYENMTTRQAKRIDEQAKRIDELEAQVEDLDKHVAQLQAEIKSRDEKLCRWAAGIDLLIKQVVARGDTPIWKPEIV